MPLNEILKNKKFGVFGLGISGIATMKYLKRYGVEFIAYDDQENTISSIRSNYQYLAENLTDLSSYKWEEVEYLVLSPGIPLTFPKPHPVIKLASKAKIISDLELLYLDNPDAFFIGITGTNGKSTTTSLIGHILNYNKINAIVAGNIGIPVLDIESEERKAVYVIETSSFQLELLDKMKFNIGILLNITPDHLDRHGNMENYTNAKYRIFKHKTDLDSAIINSNLNKNSNMLSFSGDLQADVCVNNNKLYFKDKIYDLPSNNSLLGEHNQQNLAAAIACCIKYGLNIENIIAAIPSFVGLNHRMQYLGKHNGITFINDSKATNADSTSKALASFDNIIWIVGGKEKEGGIASLKEFFPKIKKALLIGDSSENFANTLANHVSWQKCGDLQNAFNIACSIAKTGDVVLLSPACASFDQWKSFEKRGESFIELVAKYKEL